MFETVETIWYTPGRDQERGAIEEKEEGLTG